MLCANIAKNKLQVVYVTKVYTCVFQCTEKAVQGEEITLGQVVLELYFKDISVISLNICQIDLSFLHCLDKTDLDPK